MALSHPYSGIRHDGILYLGDALARIVPGGFDQDLYFLFGSQGRYTVLPRVYAALIAAFGIGTGTIVALISAGVGYLFATWYLVSAFTPERMRFYCVLSVVLGWSIYGGYRIFSFGEPFLTARSFAEPAVLFGLGLFYRGKPVASLLMLLIGAIFHPLIAVGAFIVVWFDRLQQNPKWLYILPVGGLTLAVLGWWGVGPFADTFLSYDATWLALARESNPQAFVFDWSLRDYGVVVYESILLILAVTLVADRREARFIRSCLFAGLAATFTSLLIVDVAHSTFFGKLQLWRALWITQWIAMATLPLTIKGLWKLGEHGRVASFFLIIGWMSSFSLAPAAVGVIAFGIYRYRARIVISNTITRIVAGVTALVALTLVVQHLFLVFSLASVVERPFADQIGQALALNVTLFVLIGVLWHARRQLKRVSPVLFGALVVASMLLWDQRTAWTRTIESTSVGEHIWPGLIEQNAKVYWYRELIAPWILLGHANYYTPQQGSGAVFSRDMVVELERRRKITELLEFQEQLCRVVNSLNEKAASCEPDALVVRDLCVEGKIDYVVLQNTLEGHAPFGIFATGVVENGFEKKFYLYRCSGLIAG